MSQEIPKENEKKALVKYVYPKAPPKNSEFRKNNAIVDLTTNLMKLKISENEQKLCIYSVSIEPELARDNYSLFSKIQRTIEPQLNKIFQRKFFSGYNLFASSNSPPKEAKLKTNVENKDFTVILKYVSEMEMSKIVDFEGDNQRKKSFIEKIIKDILLKNKNTIKFGDSRTIVKVNTKNIFDKNTKETVYKGYYTSAQITENGLYLLVLNINKHIRHITVLEKLKELKQQFSNLQESNFRNEIDKYFKTHKTVLTTYGSLRTYRVDSIDFDSNPRKTCFNIKEGEVTKTITVYDYFKIQYNIIIQDENQPLIIAESKAKRKLARKKENQEDKNSNENNNNNHNQNTQEERTIYLVPELLYITENTMDNKDKNNRRQLGSKTKVDPNSKMEEINSIHQLIKSTSNKTYKNRDGTIVQCKSPLEVSEEWGISLGNNLEIKGRILPQPKLLYGRDKKVFPNNGRFKSEVTLKGVTLNKNNFIYIYDQTDNSDIKLFLRNLMDKARNKDMKLEAGLNEIHGVGLKGNSKWENIYNDLKIVKAHANHIQMAVVFLSSHLEKYYSKLKSFFTNEAKFATQFVISKKLQDVKKAGSMMFNIVEQINIKMGGTNFYIDFYNEKILTPGKIYMILGLECRSSPKGIEYVLTSSTSQNLNKIVTSIETSKNVQEDKERAIQHLLDLALTEIKKSGAPNPPDYIILYRQGGNTVQNRRLLETEVPIFTNFLKNKFNNFNTKFIYICCNLKSDFKFFEKNQNSFSNPKSGLCVDSSITQKDKYEFYIQPQLVNQGTATPCHYQVLYENRDENNPENNMKIEQLELLSFYLSFYYWTWSGAIRVPGALKLATTAMDFYIKHLDGRIEKENKQFKNPEYI